MENPYQAPSASPHEQPQAPHPDLFHDGECLIVRDGTTLPPICVKTGVDLTGPSRSRKLSWHPQWVTFTILISLLIYVVLAAIMTKRARVQYFSTPEAHRSWRLGLAGAWVFCLLGVVLLIAGFIASAEGIHFVWPIGLVMLIAGIVLSCTKARLMSVKKIEDGWVWLKLPKKTIDAFQSLATPY